MNDLLNFTQKKKQRRINQVLRNGSHSCSNDDTRHVSDINVKKSCYTPVCLSMFIFAVRVVLS